LTGRNWATCQLSFPNFLYDKSDNPSEKNDSRGDMQCREFYVFKESLEIEEVALFALARLSVCVQK
jgi:hypothetical protein